MQDNKQALAQLREDGGGEEGVEAFRPTDVRVQYILCMYIHTGQMYINHQSYVG